MKKGTFKYYLKSNAEEFTMSGDCSYYEDEQLLRYNDSQDMLVTLNLRNNSLCRENAETRILLDFSGNHSYIEIKQLKKYALLSIDVIYLKNDAHKFKVSYILNDADKFIFIIEWDLEGDNNEFY